MNWLLALESPQIMVPAIIGGIFTLVGAFLGAFFAGRYSINVMKEQIKNEKITREIESIVEFIKFWNVFKGYIGVVMTSLDEVSKLFSQEQFPFQNIQIIQMRCTKNRETLDIIRSLPHNNIPIEIHSSYMGILARATLINSLFNSVLVSEENEDSKKEILMENDKNLNGLYDDMDLFREFVLEQKEELNELNK